MVILLVLLLGPVALILGLLLIRPIIWLLFHPGFWLTVLGIPVGLVLLVVLTAMKHH
jgi:hypothetical protein